MMNREPVNHYYDFEPELIVEITSVCDHACVGCYAPNFVSRSDHELTFYKRPELYLDTDTLRERMGDVTSSVGRQLRSLSFRGGEPTCHPNLPSLIELSLKYTPKLFVESHGRWVLPDQKNTGLDRKNIISAVADPHVVLKISFDSMHKLSAKELKHVLLILDEENVNWLVAITERDCERFLHTRNQCNWLPDSKIVYQPHAAFSFQLYRPPFGVIRSSGEHARSLSTRESF